MRPTLGLIPASVCILSVGTFVVCYAISVSNGNVSPYFPYISDTGANLPERTIFGEFLTLSSFFAITTFVIRYKLVAAFSRDSDPTVTRLNIAGLVLGCFSCLGLTLVANFQNSPPMIDPVHLTGACLVFGLGVIYIFLQSAISYRATYNSKSIAHIRLTIGLLSCSAFVIAVISAIFANQKWKNEGAVGDKKHWKPDQPGYQEHLISTFAEWIMAITFNLFFFTYIRDFNRVKVGFLVDPLVDHLANDPGRVVPYETTHLTV